MAIGERSSIADREILGADPAGELVALADGEVDGGEADDGVGSASWPVRRAATYCCCAGRRAIEVAQRRARRYNSAVYRWTSGREVSRREGRQQAASAKNARVMGTSCGFRIPYPDVVVGLRKPGLQGALLVSTRSGVQASLAASRTLRPRFCPIRVSRTLYRNGAPERLLLGQRADLFNRRVAFTAWHARRDWL